MTSGTCSIAGSMASSTPTAIIRWSLTHLMMAGKHKMKAKYRKEKQTDTSALLSPHDVDFASSLATIAGTASQAWASGVIPTSQNHNLRNAYTDVPIFLT